MANMEIRYTPHAVDRMIQRQISTADVEVLLTEPDGSIRQSQDKIIVYRNIEHRPDNALAVVAVERGDHIEVITVMVNFEVPP